MEFIIESDPVLNQILRVNTFQYDLLDMQIEIYKSCFLIALERYIDYKFKHNTD